MKKVKGYLVNTYGKTASDGEAAGVVLNAEGLSDSTKAHMARELNTNETAFVVSSDRDKAQFKLEFYTPDYRLDNCSRATLAAFHLLREQGWIKDKSAESHNALGINRIFFDTGMTFFEQPPSKYEWPPQEMIQKTAEAFNLSEQDISSEPHVGDTGLRFLLLPIANLNRLHELRPNLERCHTLSYELNVIGFYAFARLEGSPDVVTARMFAPRIGVTEGSATGLAAGPLVCSLTDNLGLEPKDDFSVEQGRHMKSPARIHSRIFRKEGKITSIWVGGNTSIREERNL
jgi:PhzF family phenazine biosynthesis protein